MITRRKFVSTALAAASVQRLARAQTCAALPGTPIEPTTNQIQAILQNRLPVGPNYGAAVGFASPSFGAHVVCMGSLLDQLGNPMAFTTDTPFEIASITKTVTASVYEWLVQTRRIGQNDELGRFIGRGVSAAIRAIPLFDLANFTSGLPSDDFQPNGTLPSSLNGDYTIADLFSFLENPAFTIVAPGTTYSYSNLGFSLLAIALEAAARAESFGGLVSAEILSPLGMVKTQPYTGALGATLPRGFDTSGNPAAPGASNFPAYFGAGGLVSTPNDMMTWLQFNMGIIQSEPLEGILPAVHLPAAAGVSNLPANTLPGLGWFNSVVSKSGSPLTLIQKNGDLTGFSSQIAFLPANGCSMSPAGAFALVNGGNGTATEDSAAQKIAYDLLFTIAGLFEP